MPSSYKYPVIRIGNCENPKLIILLENQNSDFDHIKWNPEYAMDKDKLYLASGMKFSYVLEYDKWWFRLAEIWRNAKFDDSDILALEYYPYATSKDPKLKDKDIYKKKCWDEFAIKALQENKKMLRKAMNNKIPIFVYYKSMWYKEIPELIDYTYISHPVRSFPHKIRGRFIDFLNKITKKAAN